SSLIRAAAGPQVLGLILPPSSVRPHRLNTERTVPPSEEYKRRLSANEASVRHFDKLHARMGGARLALAAIGIAVAWAALYSRVIAPIWLLVPVAAFIVLVACHQTVRRGRTRAERIVTFYRAGLARIEERWMGTGSTGER